MKRKQKSLDGIVCVLGALATYSSSSAKNKLGVIFDSCFKFDQQITQVVKTCFFQSRLLRKVKAYFPLNDFESHPLVYKFWCGLL